jgi:hypothetical protein
VHLAVRAHIRHSETNYDELIGRGRLRDEAREQVAEAIEQVMLRWSGA